MTKTKNKRNVAGVAERNRIALASLKLANDKVFKKLSERERLNLIEEVINIGDEAARGLIAAYKIDDPRKIAVKLGLRILGETRGTLKRSEYRPHKHEIAISKRFHEKLLAEVRSRELAERLLKLVVANELFHHLEETQLGSVDKRYKFTVWQLGPFKINRQVKGLSEVAAQAFTHTLLGLDLTPPLFDYLLLATF